MRYALAATVLMVSVVHGWCYAQDEATHLVRPAGTLTRHAQGVKHPDLDEAWTAYDSKVTESFEVLRNFISLRVDAASSTGDLEQAEKWIAAMEAWNNAGVFPAEVSAPAKPNPRPAKPGQKEAIDFEHEVTQIKKRLNEAAKELQAAYDAVIKTLTMQKQFAEARRVKDELDKLSAELTTGKQPGRPAVVVIEAKNYKSASPKKDPQVDALDRASPDWDGLTVQAASTLCWDIPVPVKGEYYIHVHYAIADPRPCDIFVDGRLIQAGGLKDATGGAKRRHLRWATFGPVALGPSSELAIDPHQYGPHFNRIVISREKSPPKLD